MTVATRRYRRWQRKIFKKKNFIYYSLSVCQRSCAQRAQTFTFHYFISHIYDEYNTATVSINSLLFTACRTYSALAYVQWLMHLLLWVSERRNVHCTQIFIVMIVRRVSAASFPSACAPKHILFVWLRRMKSQIGSKYIHCRHIAGCVCVCKSSSLCTHNSHSLFLVQIWLAYVLAYSQQFIPSIWRPRPYHHQEEVTRLADIYTSFPSCCLDCASLFSFCAPESIFLAIIFYRHAHLLTARYFAAPSKFEWWRWVWVWVLGYIHRCVLCANNVNRMLLKFVGNDLLQLIVVKNVAATAQKNETYRRRRCWVKLFCRKTTKKWTWKREGKRERGGENCSDLTLLCWKTHLIAAAGVPIAIQLFSATN